MKIKVITVSPQEGESIADAIKRAIESDIAKGLSPVDLTQDDDTCQCNVCQLRRELQSHLEEIKPNKVEPGDNPSDLQEQVSENSVFLDNGTYNFSSALEAMRNGYRVVRGTWPAVLSIAMTDEKPSGIDDTYVPAENHIAQFYSEIEDPSEGWYLTPYNFTQEDILATDWKILKYKI